MTFCLINSAEILLCLRLLGPTSVCVLLSLPIQKNISAIMMLKYRKNWPQSISFSCPLETTGCCRLCYWQHFSICLFACIFVIYLSQSCSVLNISKISIVKVLKSVPCGSQEVDIQNHFLSVSMMFTVRFSLYLSEYVKILHTSCLTLLTVH